MFLERLNLPCIVYGYGRGQPAAHVRSQFASSEHFATQARKHAVRDAGGAAGWTGLERGGEEEDDEGVAWGEVSGLGGSGATVALVAPAASSPDEFLVHQRQPPHPIATNPSDATTHTARLLVRAHLHASFSPGSPSRVDEHQRSHWS